QEILDRFEKSVVPKVVNLQTGEYATDIDPATFDQRKAAADPNTSTPAPPNAARVLRLPNHGLVYHVMKAGQVDALILPIEGYGLWSTMYGYLALEKDGRTVSGITFYEHGETPGLGGEIENPSWQARWEGRSAVGEDGKVKLQVIKG